MERKFKAGDVVTLSSGGPKMTVQNYHSGYNADPEFVFCTWFVNGEEYNEPFHQDSLRLEE